MFRDVCRGRGRGRKCISGPVMDKNDESFRTVLEEMQNLGFTGQGYIFDAIENFDDINTFGNNIHPGFYDNNREDVEEEQMRDKKEQVIKNGTIKNDIIPDIERNAPKPRGRRPKNAMTIGENSGLMEIKNDKDEEHFLTVMRPTMKNENFNQNIINNTTIPFEAGRNMQQMAMKRKRGRPRKEEMLQQTIMLMNTQRKRGRPRKDTAAYMFEGDIKSISKREIKKKNNFPSNINMRMIAGNANMQKTPIVEDANMQEMSSTMNNFYSSDNIDISQYSPSQTSAENKLRRIKPTDILPAALAFTSAQIPIQPQIPALEKRKKGRPRKFF